MTEPLERMLHDLADRVEEIKRDAALLATIDATESFGKFVNRDPEPTLAEVREWVRINLGLLNSLVEDEVRSLRDAIAIRQEHRL